MNAHVLLPWEASWILIIVWSSGDEDDNGKFSLKTVQQTLDMGSIYPYRTHNEQHKVELYPSKHDT